MDLFIMRHGEAGKKLSSDTKDYNRSLTVEGKKEVTEIAKSLKYLGIKFNFIITSPLKRTYQTASLVAMAFDSQNKIEQWDELKPEGNRIDFYRKLSERFKQDSSILIVGHEPYLSSFISEIVSKGDVVDGAGGHLVLRKAGLAKVRITPSHQKIQGELRWLLTPKIIKKISK
jgi:phosphohistidine phosphatase